MHGVSMHAGVSADVVGAVRHGLPMGAGTSGGGAWKPRAVWDNGQHRWPGERNPMPALTVTIQDVLEPPAH